MLLLENIERNADLIKIIENYNIGLKLRIVKQINKVLINLGASSTNASFVIDSGVGALQLFPNNAFNYNSFYLVNVSAGNASYTLTFTATGYSFSAGPTIGPIASGATPTIQDETTAVNALTVNFTGTISASVVLAGSPTSFGTGNYTISAK